MKNYNICLLSLWLLCLGNFTSIAQKNKANKTEAKNEVVEKEKPQTPVAVTTTAPKEEIKPMDNKVIVEQAPKVPEPVRGPISTITDTTSTLRDAISAYRLSKTLVLNNNAVKGSYKLPISFYKTTHIIFDSPVKYFDIGSSRVIGEVAEGLSNVFKIKATEVGNFETNVTVVTHNGKFYSYIVSYMDNPLKLNINMSSVVNMNLDSKDGIYNDKIIFVDTYYSEKEINELAKKVVAVEGIKHILDKTGGVKFKLSNVSSKDGFILLNVTIKNDSKLDYQLEFIKFYVRDRERKKKEVTQEYEVKPTYAYVERVGGGMTDTSLCASKTEFNFVFMLPRFVIDYQKNMEVDIVEKNGGRNGNLKIDYDTFFNQMIKL